MVFLFLYFLLFLRRVYVNYPVGTVQFFQETMPSGYSEDRVFRYEDGGVVKSHREITMKDGVIVSTGTFCAEKFPEDSPILTQTLKSPVPPQEVITSYKNGVRSMCNFVSMHLYQRSKHFSIQVFLTHTIGESYYCLINQYSSPKERGQKPQR